MNEYTAINKNEEYNNVTVQFHNEKEKPFAIGEKMYEINPEAYMNGYNWDAIFNYYLGKNHPELLEELEPDPEAGSYFAYYPLTDENEEKAKKFVQVIIDLIENEEKLYTIVKEEADSILWD